jgi:hypothetical protein
MAQNEDDLGKVVTGIELENGKTAFIERRWQLFYLPRRLVLLCISMGSRVEGITAQ